MLPVLRELPQAELARAAGLSRRRLRDLLQGRATPREGTRAALVGLAADFAREELARRGEEPPADQLAACAAYLAFP